MAAEACAKALHLVGPDGSVLHSGRAMLRILSLIGWPRSAAFLALPPFIWCVELGYRLVASNRGKISAELDKRQ